MYGLLTLQQVQELFRERDDEFCFCGHFFPFFQRLYYVAADFLFFFFQLLVDAKRTMKSVSQTPGI